jgi:hypothetical protein
MKNRVDIEPIRRLFIQQRDNHEFAEAIYLSIEYQKVRVSKPFTIGAPSMLDTYTTREKFQSEFIDKETIQGYNSLLPNLAKEADNIVSVFEIITKQACYIVFADTYLKRLVGILKISDLNLETEEQTAKEYQGMGSYDLSEAFENGKKLKE